MLNGATCLGISAERKAFTSASRSGSVRDGKRASVTFSMLSVAMRESRSTSRVPSPQMAPKMGSAPGSLTFHCTAARALMWLPSYDSGWGW